MRSSDGEGRSIRSDALYPALSGEWEVPVIRNAKITPVDEGGGGRGRGASPPGSPLAGSPVTRNAEIDPPPRLIGGWFLGLPIPKAVPECSSRRPRRGSVLSSLQLHGH